MRRHVPFLLSHLLRLLPVLLIAAAAPLPVLGASVDLRGQMAPDFALKSLAGDNLRLSEMRGEVVMINFWATWCGPCREEMPLLNQIYRQYHPVGFELLGVNIDEASGHAADMAHTLGVSFPVLFDDSKAVARLYGVSTMPMTLLVDRNGKVRYVDEGYESGREQTYINQVRELLKE